MTAFLPIPAIADAKINNIASGQERQKVAMPFVVGGRLLL